MAELVRHDLLRGVVARDGGIIKWPRLIDAVTGTDVAIVKVDSHALGNAARVLPAAQIDFLRADVDLPTTSDVVDSKICPALGSPTQDAVAQGLLKCGCVQTIGAGCGVDVHAVAERSVAVLAEQPDSDAPHDGFIHPPTHRYFSTSIKCLRSYQWSCK